MRSRWPLQDAKNRLSQVVEQARRRGLQTIIACGREKVVAAKDDKHLTSLPVPLTEFFRQSPLYGIDLDLERSSDTGRDAAL